MANRRMIAKTIVESDAFVDMPASTRLLYYDLNIRADDDGFVNAPKKILRETGASSDDIGLLVAKKFIIPFESGIVVIKHWKIHNYIQADRYTETKYKKEKAELTLDDNNSYKLGGGIPENKKLSKPLTDAQQKRYEAKKESDLPYSFEYKIRSAFVGEPCPICNCTMSHENKLVHPTIQHNIPISLGGKHEIENISVICQSCNTSIQNKEITDALNNDKVIEKWLEIGNVSGMDTQVRLGKSKDRLGKDSIEGLQPLKNIIPPTPEMVLEYCLERNSQVDPGQFYDFYETKGWKVGKEKMKDWQACIRTWEKRNTKTEKGGNSFIGILSEYED